METKRASRSGKSGKPKNLREGPGKKRASSQHCWPGFKPTPGKTAGEKGSCQPKAGRQSAAVRREDQKRAAASKLRKRQSA